MVWSGLDRAQTAGNCLCKGLYYIEHTTVILWVTMEYGVWSMYLDQFIHNILIIYYKIHTNSAHCTVHSTHSGYAKHCVVNDMYDVWDTMVFIQFMSMWQVGRCLFFAANTVCNGNEGVHQRVQLEARTYQIGKIRNDTYYVLCTNSLTGSRDIRKNSKVKPSQQEKKKNLLIKESHNFIFRSKEYNLNAIIHCESGWRRTYSNYRIVSNHYCGGFGLVLMINHIMRSTTGHGMKWRFRPVTMSLLYGVLHTE